MATRKEKLDCVRREIAMREKVYPRWVSFGRMTKADADREIRTMMEIAEDYADADDQGRLEV